MYMCRPAGKGGMGGSAWGLSVTWWLGLVGLLIGSLVVGGCNCLLLLRYSVGWWAVVRIVVRMVRNTWTNQQGRCRHSG